MYQKVKTKQHRRHARTASTYWKRIILLLAMLAAVAAIAVVASNVNDDGGAGGYFDNYSPTYIYEGGGYGNAPYYSTVDPYYSYDQEEDYDADGASYTYEWGAGGYIGIMPTANFAVIFNPNNDGTTHYSDFEARWTQNDGTIGATAMPPNPEWYGHQFMVWTRTQDGGSNATGNAAGEHFTATSHVTAGQDPFTVYAQWGNTISFHSTYSTLNIPAGANPNNVLHYGPRMVNRGRSFVDSNDLVWTPAQIWPNNPANVTFNGATHFFTGWYTKDYNGYYYQRVDANTPIIGNTRVYARFMQRQLRFDPRDGVTAPEDFAVRYLTGTGASNIGGVGNIPPAPTHPDGLRFMGWTRSAEGLATGTGNAANERLIATATFTVA